MLLPLASWLLLVNNECTDSMAAGFMGAKSDFQAWFYN
jgi:hypothetical protein